MNLTTKHISPVQIDLRRELLDQGWNDRAISRMVRMGAWTRIRHGAYCDAAAWASLSKDQRHLVRTRAVLLQSRTPLVVSHSSALPWYDAPTWGTNLADVHVTRRDGRIGRHEAGVHQHRGRLLDGDVSEVAGTAVMSPTRVVLEVTTQVSAEAGLVVANYFLHAGLTTGEALDARYRQCDHPMDVWPRSLRTDLVLRRAHPAIESVGESRTYHLCFLHHLPKPTPQVDIVDQDGRFLGRVDFAWPEHGVFLEFDGKVKYEKLLKPGQRASDVVVEEKRREEAICRATGWRCIRIVWADLEHPARTAALIRSYLTAA